MLWESRGSLVSLSTRQAEGAFEQMNSESKQASVTKPSCCAPRAEFARSSVPETAIVASGASSRENAGLQSAAIALPGGRFLMGTDYARGFPADGEGPVRPVVLSPFSIDTFPVTNQEFAAFVEATGYRTDAERFGWSFVFWLQIPEDRFEELVEDTAAATPWWCRVPEACWREPEGPGSHVGERARHPVVHVSWNDASVYAAWAGKQLPTEAQWEYAARGGLEQKLYPWGDELTPEGLHLCNIWQGKFPLENTAEDGYAGTCPVDAFPPNGFGLYSATGNVWEWCSDWFHAEFSTAPV